MAKKTDASFFEAGRSLHESMPRRVRLVFDAVAALDALQAVAEGVRSSTNQSGALESTLLLAKVQHAVESAPTMASARDYADDFKVVNELWWLQVEVHTEKCAKTKVVNELLKKYGDLPEWIKDWNFAKLPWVTVEKDEERDKLGKNVQEIFLTFPVMQSVMERIAKEMETFATKEQLKVATEAVATTRLAASQIQAAKLLMAQMIMVGVFVAGEREGKSVEETKKKPEYEPALGYCRKTLKIELGQYPAQLQDRIMGKVAETQSAVASSSTNTPTVANDAADGLPKKKKARRSLLSDE